MWTSLCCCRLRSASGRSASVQPVSNTHTHKHVLAEVVSYTQVRTTWLLLQCDQIWSDDCRRSTVKLEGFILWRPWMHLQPFMPILCYTSLSQALSFSIVLLCLRTGCCIWYIQWSEGYCSCIYWSHSRCDVSTHLLAQSKSAALPATPERRDETEFVSQKMLRTHMHTCTVWL